ncbi:flavin oxidoreductase [Virgibacillus pantothenticus]|uniref:Flavin reductase n=1 Tax=Virgibacillus pantothenticus TaxID=1473 RepID=A0A0L0QMS2_VIRPA|nr:MULTISPECIES: flavin reductase family protein [Virgibacillus]API93616.1 flavin reductase [Virgibacillus sp. 6R]KNE19907.1 flavin reductase [Virgibacillus pantothenticus]MBS7429992.1 flavin reductase family protein [Virgibacillus sp. 19R1-5]MBU8564910.1 flavin reductase family protein [Virgibacillus pantothenticus]MBU8599218.1 flavin reductase family protein [Virgibacillus pantothenticus]
MDSRAFRNAMSCFATGVTVITTKVEEETHGMTANAFMSVSLEPKLITVSIDNRANMLTKIYQSEKFAVNVLADTQQDISMHFANQAKKYEEVPFDILKGVPIIQDALVSVVCEVDRAFEVGDHTLFIGKVEAIHSNNGNPLTFYKGQYGKYEPAEYV